MGKDKGKREVQGQLGERQTARGRHLASRAFWLYFEVGEDGALAIETSVLPDAEEISRPLRVVGWRRDSRGGFRVELRSDLAIESAVRSAVRVMREEAE